MKKSQAQTVEIIQEPVIQEPIKQPNQGQLRNVGLFSGQPY